jgi:hypothetical protein
MIVSTVLVDSNVLVDLRTDDPTWAGWSSTANTLDYLGADAFAFPWDALLQLLEHFLSAPP